MQVAHDHHAHGAPADRSAATHRTRVRALQIALAANGGSFVVQLVVGIADDHNAGTPSPSATL